MLQTEVVNVVNAILILILVGICCWFSYMLGSMNGYDAGVKYRDLVEEELDIRTKKR